MTRYKALALQTTCYAVNAARSRAEVAERMQTGIRRIGQQIRASKAFIGPDTRLVVLPEYFLTGFPMGESIETWADKACIEPDGPEYRALGALSKELNLYIAGNAYELDEHFPGLYFQTNFVTAPDGAVILRYRRLNSMFAPTPHDVWEKYLEIYGYEAVFPVVKTEIGALACIASEEILYPEIARCLMLRGAEVFLHSTSEVGSPLLTQKNVAKLARAIENMAYVVSANSAGIAGIDIPFASTDGGSKIVDYEGRILAEAAQGESMVAHTTLDLEALRHARRRVGMGNFIARQRLELYAPAYAAQTLYPANSLAGVLPERSHFVKTQQQTIQKLIEQGVVC
jgi:predicted amidohydrolase